MDNTICWNREAFVTKTTLRYACVSPTGFEETYLKAQSNHWGEGGEQEDFILVW